MVHSLTRQNLRGIWHALLTPWTAQDELDEPRYRREIQCYRDCGLHGLYTGGTTGEFYAQDDQTFQRITAITCEEVHALGLPVQIGCTALSTAQVRRKIRFARSCGADAIQLAFPFWLQVSVEEAIEFLQDVAQAAEDTPLVLYQTSRAKLKLLADDLARAGEKVPTLIGTKDTGCDLDTLKQMNAATDIAVFGGDENLLARHPHGGKGAYCSFTGLSPHAIVLLWDLIQQGKDAHAQQIVAEVHKLLHGYLLPLYKTRHLQDSALDRLMRQLGGGDVGLSCQKPYHSATETDLQNMRRYCQTHTPILLVQDRQVLLEQLSEAVSQPVVQSIR